MTTFKNPEKAHSPYILDFVPTPAGEVPRVTGKLKLRDVLGTFMVRWSVNRDNYRVSPGLYAIGDPTDSSDVFVTANYKLSFDHLRKSIDGLNAWILVLDTSGINVWCAAGKGTFGTKELVNRIRMCRLEDVISHRRIIVPQLGAVGISAYQVRDRTTPAATATLTAGSAGSTKPLKLSFNGLKVSGGFNVVFGPVKAEDIKAFIRNNYHATREMRRVTFTFSERARLIPVDFVYGKYKLLIAFALFFVLSGLTRKGVSFQLALEEGPYAVLNILMAYVAGIVITPMALPYLPGRSFAFKGFVSGTVAFVLTLLINFPGLNFPEMFAWFLIMCSISSFTAMNFTGSSTYTSLSGVKKEMKVAIPIQLISTIAGLVFFIIGRLF